MLEVGYTTGTFDLVHQGHFEILRKCKLYCKYLLVGLVSDKLGEKQKRKPVLDYEHRKSILENCKYVDGVVKFIGSTKQEDYKKLKFNILFIADEYYGSSEYSSFARDYPDISVIYFPRTCDVSSTDIYKKIINNIIAKTTIKAKAISGDILAIEWKNNRNLIIKPVRLSSIEKNNTANNYDLNIPPPRNWKILGENKINHPFISGVNGNRELYVFDILKDKIWYLVINIQKKSTNNIEINNNNLSGIELMNEERKYSEHVFWMIQNDGGETLDIYLKNKDINIRKKIYTIIRNIINEMKSMGILHMDLHPKNILCSKLGVVSIIDFGWVMYKNFCMDTVEKEYYDKCLRENFDLYHFRESLIYTGLEENIPDCLL